MKRLRSHARLFMPSVAGTLLGLMSLGCAQDTSALEGATQAVEVSVPEEMRAAPFDVPRELMVPPGFGIEVLARVEGARFLAVAPNEDILVSQPNNAFGQPPREGKIVLLRRQEGQLLQTFDLVTGLLIPHDLVFHTIDNVTYLYVAAGDQIVRYVYEDGATSLTNGEAIVTGLPTEPLEGEAAYRHPLKSLALDGNTLYVMIASSTNANPADLEANPKRGAIYTFDATTPSQEATSGTLFANGIRNAEGLAFAPGTSELWAVVNNRDETPYPFHDDWENDGTGDDYGKIIQSFVDNYPAEEIIKVQEGAHYGWPFCNPNPANSFDNMPFDNDVETNADGQAFDCTTATQIDKGAQAHSAPLGASFWTNGPEGYENALTVAFHGSWNRSSFSGHKVSMYPYENGTLGDEIELVTGWVTDAEAQGRWGRPVDTEPMADGSLLISDDESGTIYRLFRTE
jgi:glucose/arabinose dehydrogenase